MGKTAEKVKDCTFCHREVSAIASVGPYCKTGLTVKKETGDYCKKHSCGSGDQTRRTEGEYEGGYVD